MSMLIDAYRFGPVVTGYPVVLSVTPSIFTSAGTSHAVAMPATVNNLDLLVCVICTDGSSTNSAVATPSGWTALATVAQANSSIRASSFYRVADGTEGGTTVNFATTGSEEAAALVLRYQAGTYSGTPESAAAAVNSNTTAALPALSPTWGSQPVSWIGAFFVGGAHTLTGWPYPDNQTSANALPSAMAYVSTKNETASSRPAGSYTTLSGLSTAVTTIAVRGA